ncbi:ATPase family AAA domain-containing protein FIGL1 isoform X1 [Oryza glaberrima]|uniref:ATPase family AAA domain-containing protein FIGL1 isoform X1 n=1 Tax=Oryza glaberrima TaxID=4538 RepID=UPI00224C11BA|nr:ATPase family AAA domain-containing protein FIGL1 isoform X1 [Oryza glaberrima]
MAEQSHAGGGGASSGEPTNWRKEADERLRRLHSLQFGADVALEGKDPAGAQVLALRLLGFLDSQALPGDGGAAGHEASFVAPIRAAASSSVAAAIRARAGRSDSAVFKLAEKDVGCVFAKTGEVNIEKIKCSKYFQALLQKSKGHAAEQMETTDCQDSTIEEGLHVEENSAGMENEKLSIRASKLVMQRKLTSLRSHKPLKANGVQDGNMFKSVSSISKESVAIENGVRTNHTDNKYTAYMDLEDDDRPRGLLQNAKRKHAGFRSPICERANSPLSNDEADAPANEFVTARTKLEMDSVQKYGHNGTQGASVSPQCDNNPNNRNYGVRPTWNSRRGLRGNFVPPIRNNGGSTSNMTSRVIGKNDDSMGDSTRKCLEMLCGPDGELPEKLRNLEPRLIEHVSNEIMDKDPNVRWDDIAGLEHAKKCVTEMVIWPLLRPDIFRGCRSPGRGLLLFGPPGTGKTMIGKAIAGEAKATFFYISASSLTSKWIGEGEKLVRALFGVACCRQPAVIFVDEIDSLLSQRKSDGEHESSRRLKTQFLIEMEGFDSGNDQILLIGATNRPQELDEAARRRLTKRLYIPLPSPEARAWIIRNLLEKDGLFKLSEEETNIVCKLTEGYSGSDMKNLVKDASMGPLREALQQGVGITKLNKEDMRPVMLKDFETALQEVRPSVSSSELGTYEEWNRQFGSLAN